MTNTETTSTHDTIHGTCGGVTTEERVINGIIICGGCNRPQPNDPRSNHVRGHDVENIR